VTHYVVTYGVEVQIDTDSEELLAALLTQDSSWGDNYGPVIPVAGSRLTSVQPPGLLTVKRRAVWLLNTEEGKL
jgi:hypothetical protein